MNMPNHFQRSTRQNGGDAPAQELIALQASTRHTPLERHMLQEYVVQPYLVQRPVQPSATQHLSTQQARRAALYVLAAWLISAGFSPAARSDTRPASAGTVATNATGKDTLRRSPLAQPIATNHGNMLTGLRWQQYSRIAMQTNRNKALLPVSAMPVFKPQGARPAVNKRYLAGNKTLKVPAFSRAQATQPAPFSRTTAANAAAGRMTTVRGIGVAPLGVRSLSQPVAVQPDATRVRVSRPAATPWLVKVATATPAAATPAASTRPAGGPTRAVLLPGTTLPSASRVKVPGRGLLPPAMLISPPPFTAQLPLSAKLPLSSQMPQSAQFSAQLPQLAHLSLYDKTNPTAQLGWRDAKGAPMRKVITVSSLKKLPPATQPLPVWMRGATINVDQVTPSLPPTSRNGRRLAQNPAASPLRQPSRPVTNSDRLPNQIEVSVGTFVVLLTTSDLDTVAVAEPGISDVAVVNSRSVLVNGKTPGITSLVIVDRQRIRQYQVRVVAAPGTLPRDIASQIGLPGVGVRQVRDAVVLEGEVENAEEMRRAVEIAGVFSTKVINQLSVRGAPSSAAATETQIERAIDLPNVRARLVGTEAVLLQGTVERPVQRQQAEIIATAFGKRVVNLIELPPLSVEQVQQALGGATRLNSPTDSTEQNSNATNTQGTLNPTISARQSGDQIILEGTAGDQAQVEQAIVIAARTGFQVINRVQISATQVTEASFRRQIEEAVNLPGVRVSGNERLVILQGTVADTNDSIRAEHIARAYSGEVQNLLQTRNPIAVNIDVSIVEINRDDARNLGVQVGSVALLSESVTPATPTTTTTGPGGTPVIVPGTPGSIQRTIDPTLLPGQFLGGNGFVGGQSLRNLNPFRVRLDALYQTGAARLLSNPRTTVNTGRLASFQVGGQVPVPSLSTVGANGTTTGIEFKDFGILVNVMPSATTDGVVTMRLATEVSQPDFSNGVTPPGGGSPIPGFSRRSTVTEVTVPPNGTVALSGLIQNNITRTVSRIPVLSRIPILGSLFQSKRFQRNETELIIFVTPRVLPNPLLNNLTAPVTITSALDNPGTPAFGTAATRDAGRSSRGGANANTGGGAGNTGGAQ
ncbi:MAG TPA: BON domain-containing protein [Abditibacteriaceae bacterium]|jgi:Flp pilus assembly secretin CpaC